MLKKSKKLLAVLLSVSMCISTCVFSFADIPENTSNYPIFNDTDTHYVYDNEHHISYKCKEDPDNAGVYIVDPESVGVTEEHTPNGAGNLTTPVTCTESGIMTYTCSVCGQEYTKELPATGHEYYYYSTYAPSQQQTVHPGEIHIGCRDCSFNQYISIPAVPLDEKFCGYADSWYYDRYHVLDNIPNYEDGGTNSGTVDIPISSYNSDSNYFESISVSYDYGDNTEKTLNIITSGHFNPHSYVRLSEGDSGYHLYGSTEDAASFYYIDLNDCDCTETGESEPTCEEDGIGHLTCTNDGCSKVFENITLPALGHELETVTIPATCTERAYTYQYCNYCDYETEPVPVGESSGDPLGHISPLKKNEVYSYPATCNSEGLLIMYCDRDCNGTPCDYETQTVIPKTPYHCTISWDQNGEVYETDPGQISNTPIVTRSCEDSWTEITCLECNEVIAVYHNGSITVDSHIEFDENGDRIIVPNELNDGEPVCPPDFLTATLSDSYGPAYAGKTIVEVFTEIYGGTGHSNFTTIDPSTNNDTLVTGTTCDNTIEASIWCGECDKLICTVDSNGINWADGIDSTRYLSDIEEFISNKKPTNIRHIDTNGTVITDWTQYWVLTKGATCKEGSSAKCVCPTCGEVLATVTNGSYDDGVSATYKCCPNALMQGKTDIHTPGEVVITQPTCTACGSYEIQCSVCDEVVFKTTNGTLTINKYLPADYNTDQNKYLLPAKGHTGGEWTITKEATCKLGGEASQKCKDCDEIVTKVLHGSNGLTFSTNKLNIAESQVPSAIKERINPENQSHKYSVKSNTATCKSAGKITYMCDVCGKTTTVDTGKLDHKYDLYAHTEPTTTNVGYDKYICRSCGEIKTITLEKLEKTEESSQGATSPFDEEISKTQEQLYKERSTIDNSQSTIDGQYNSKNKVYFGPDALSGILNDIEFWDFNKTVGATDPSAYNLMCYTNDYVTGRERKAMRDGLAMQFPNEHYNIISMFRCDLYAINQYGVHTKIHSLSKAMPVVFQSDRELKPTKIAVMQPSGIIKIYEGITKESIEKMKTDYRKQVMEEQLKYQQSLAAETNAQNAGSSTELNAIAGVDGLSDGEEDDFVTPSTTQQVIINEEDIATPFDNIDLNAIPTNPLVLSVMLDSFGIVAFLE